MASPSQSLEIILTRLKLMEVTLLGLKQVRQYVDRGFGIEELDLLIQEAEFEIAGIKRRVVN
jgi:hypothetical protein